MKHKQDLEIYKFGEYWGYQCSCGEIVERFDNPKKHTDAATLSGTAAQGKG